MAALLSRGHYPGPKSVRVLQQCIRTVSGAKSHYVLLPEVPQDTAETNAVMRIDQLPQFSHISSNSCITGPAKLSIEYETKLERHIDSLKDVKAEKTFDNIYLPIEEIAVPLNTTFATVKNLHYVASSDDYRRAYAKIHPQVERVKNERWVSQPLYYSFKELEANSNNLTEYQKRIVNMYLLEGKLNGVHLSTEESAKLVDRLKLIAKESENFRNKVGICTDMFTHDVTNFNIIDEMPWPLLAQMSTDKSNPTRGPWRATLQPAVYQAMMTYCSNRLTRWNLWNAYHNRASHNHAGQYLNNNKLIENLRLYRGDVATMLGYDSFAEMSMETKMAGSCENVLGMIETLRARFAPVVWEETAQLQDFATSEGFEHSLEMWDLGYWRRRHREHLYSVDKNKVKEYFPINSVLLGLFDLCTNLFGINFEEVTPEVETWHPDVRFFNVLDSESGEHISSFYFDPFDRPGKISTGYMDLGRDNSEHMGNWPYSYLCLRIPRPRSSTDPALMRFEDIEVLFTEFGHGLQQMLTKVPYSEIAGQKNIEWDAVHVCAKFMKRWLTVPSVVKSLSSHHNTGEVIPDGLLSDMFKASQHWSNFDMMYQLYVSAFDQEIYMTDTHWDSVMKHLWDSFIPLPLCEEDNLPCSMLPIFCEMYPAAYYCKIWSEMMAADIFSAFEEAGLEDQENLKVLGKRFRDTYLSLGGGVQSCEVFRQFRGRDPTTKALQPVKL